MLCHTVRCSIIPCMGVCLCVCSRACLCASNVRACALCLHGVAECLGVASWASFSSRCGPLAQQLAEAEAKLIHDSGGSVQPVDWVGLLDEPTGKLQSFWFAKLREHRKKSLAARPAAVFGGDFNCQTTGVLVDTDCGSMADEVGTKQAFDAKGHAGRSGCVSCRNCMNSLHDLSIRRNRLFDWFLRAPLRTGPQTNQPNVV